jgi:hypothetical protein
MLGLTADALVTAVSAEGRRPAELPVFPRNIAGKEVLLRPLLNLMFKINLDTL